MGDGDRAAATDLLLERGHNAAVACQHVPEAHDHELRRRLVRHGLHEPFCEQLGAPHDAGRVDRLVGRNRDELLDAESIGQHRHLPRAEDVVFDRLRGIPFHHRHVLVRRCVKHDLRPIGLENLLHPPRVGDIGKQGFEGRAGIKAGKLLLDEKQGVLGTLHEEQPARGESDQLAADF